MTASRIRVLSGRAGVLLAAIAIAVSGYMAAGAGSGPRSGRAGATQHAVAAGSSGHTLAHWTDGTTGPHSVRHGSGLGIASAAPLSQCALAAGHPVLHAAGPASRSPVAGPMCPCCLWCACAWACCGCPGGWPPGWWSPRSHLAWRCCSRWPWPPGGGSSPIRQECGPGCVSRACPTWWQSSVPGPARAAAVSQAQATVGDGRPG